MTKYVSEEQFDEVTREEKSPAYQMRFNISGTPDLYFMLDGEVKQEISGSQPRDVLEGIISEVMCG